MHPPPLSKDANATRLEFSGKGSYASLKGEVLWSDASQQGVMRLAGLQPNDKAKSQYQLWIVDSERGGKFPVDGGVFDIPAGGGEVIIVIDSKLEVDGPNVFVITREQPGGVVVSGQEEVVAVADRNAA